MNYNQTWHNFLWILLYPASSIWLGIAKVRRFICRRSYRSSHVVVSIGNIHSGGTGKTPMVYELCDHFSSGHPIVLSRGYRGSLSRVGGQVDPSIENAAKLFGDEPTWLARKGVGVVYVGKDRVKNLRQIPTSTQSLIVLDDGFQHLSIARDIDLVVIPTARKLHNSFCLPWGELREGLGALRFATACLLNEEGDAESYAEWESFLMSHFPNLPLFSIQRWVLGLFDIEGNALDGNIKGAGFCAIGNPLGFQRDLAQYTNCVFLRAFPDHYCLGKSEWGQLEAKAIEIGADYLVTTEKDATRLQSFWSGQGVRLATLNIRYRVEEKFWDWMENQIIEMRSKKNALH